MALLVGNIACGDPTEEDENIEASIELPNVIFGSGQLFILRAKGNSMINAGIMAVITSSGTMDKLNPSVRKYLAERAELLGAIRLPNTAFKQNAGTEVVADILFFRKREQQEYITPENTEWLGTGKTEQGYEINNYFIQHPEMILGTLVEETGMYGATAVTVKPDGRTITKKIDNLVNMGLNGSLQDIFNTKLKELKEKYESAELQIAEIKTVLAKEDNLSNKINGYIKSVSNIRGYDLNRQARIIRSLVRKVEIICNGKGKKDFTVMIESVFGKEEFTENGQKQKPTSDEECGLSLVAPRRIELRIPP